jgi:hypothetical protein
MTGRPSTDAMDADLQIDDERDRFLSSHRAHGVCARELTRLSDEVARLVSELPQADGAGKPEVRHAPGRFVVQVGQAALTISWLRSTLDSVADGRLLAVAWKGTVARGASRLPERSLGPGSARTAVAVWEDTLVAEATSESDWRWRSEEGAAKSYDCAELAMRCIEPLKKALAAN